MYKKNKRNYVLFLFSVLFARCSPCIVSIETAKKIVSRNMKQYHIPGVSVIFYKNGQSFLLHLGYADKKKKKEINQDTLFELGSISKVFTCLLLAREVVSGSMMLEDPLADYIPSLGSRKKSASMNLEKLATHTSGLSFNAPAGIKSTKGLLTYISRYNPIHQHKTWNYSNHGIELLRIALEESLDTSYNNLLISHVLQPLHMMPIGTKIPYQYLSRRATPYGKDGNPTIYWNHPFLQGSAAISASSSDMLSFLKAALGVADIDPSLKEAMKITQTKHISIKNGISYGLGWQINDLSCLYSSYISTSISNCLAQSIKKSDKLFSGNLLVDKTGTTNGFQAYIAAIPAEKIGVVILMNRSLPAGYKVIRKMGRDILKAYRS